MLEPLWLAPATHPIHRPRRYRCICVPPRAVRRRRGGGRQAAHTPQQRAVPVPAPVGVLLRGRAERHGMVSVKVRCTMGGIGSRRGQTGGQRDQQAGGRRSSALWTAPLSAILAQPLLPSPPRSSQVRDAGHSGHRIGLAHRAGAAHVPPGTSQHPNAAMRCYISHANCKGCHCPLRHHVPMLHSIFGPVECKPTSAPHTTPACHPALQPLISQPTLDLTATSLLSTAGQLGTALAYTALQRAKIGAGFA